MKIFIGFIFVSILLSACGPDLSLIKEGDIIFNHNYVLSDSVFYKCSNEKETVTGLVLKHDNQLQVFCMCPTPTYCSIKSFTKSCDDIDVKRLKNANGILTPPILKKIYKCVAVFDSTSFDQSLSWSDSAMYESELVWKIYQCSTGLRLGEPQAFSTLKSNDNWKNLFSAREQKKLNNKEMAITPAMIFNSTYLYSIIESH